MNEMKDSEIKYWGDTLKMMEEDMEPRARRWRDLKLALGLKYAIDGIDDPFYISRFYKVMRDLLASVAFKHPHIYMKVEEMPQDPDSGKMLENADPILENLVNDGLDIMDAKPKVKQCIFDAAFCFRGFLKIAPAPKSSPYALSGAEQVDFTVLRRVRPEYLLVDPLVQPEDFYSARFVVEKMYPPLDAVANDPRFADFRSEILGLKAKTPSMSTLPFDPTEQDNSMDEVRRRVLLRAHQLAKTRRMYEIHDRINQKRIVFMDGINQPIENIPHPLLGGGTESRRDPFLGTRLLGRAAPSTAPRPWLVWGGFQYMSMAFDVAEDFYGDPIMAYENPIQEGIVRAFSMEMDRMNRFKRLMAIKETEAQNNKSLPANLREKPDGSFIPFTDMDSFKPIEWPLTEGDTSDVQTRLLSYEAELVGTSASAGQLPDQATGQAIVASGMEVNRNYNQDPVETLYGQIAFNTISILADERFTPKGRTLRQPSEEGAKIERLALLAWHLQGRFNITIAAGSSNILWEAMQEDRTDRMVDRLRNSQNVDQLELDKMVILAGGNIDPSKLLKPEANTDATKAAELEIEIMFALQHDPGVTPGEDHKTHMAMQDPNAVAQHPKFAQVSQAQPGLAQDVLKLAGQHVQAHQQAMQQEMGGGSMAAPGRNGRVSATGPMNLQGAVAGNAQRMQDMLSKQAEEKVGS